MLSFTTYTKEDYQVNFHHEILCNKLDDFIKGEIKNLMVFMPPQHGKSELVSRRFPAYALGIDPNLKIAGCSYSSSLSSGFNRDVQRIIDTPKYNDIFPDTYLNKSNIRTSSRGNSLRNSDIFEPVGHSGFYKSVGVGGSLTGSPVDIGIIDDPIKDSVEAFSKTTKERNWDWYTKVFKTRLHNDSKVLFTMTRWAYDDLAGRVLENEGEDWEVLSLPAIKEDDDPSDPRDIGDALWPEKHSLERLEKVRDKTPTTFVSLYQQKPTPTEGNIIKDHWFNTFNLGDINIVRKKITVDAAYTAKEENDRSAGVCYSYVNGNWYVLDVFAVRKEFPELTELLPDFVRRNDPTMKSMVLTEPKGPGKSVTQILRRWGLNAKDSKSPTTDKMARLMSQIDYWESGRIYFLNGASWVEMVLEECKQFPKGKHDDILDALMIMVDSEKSGGNPIFSARKR